MASKLDNLGYARVFRHPRTGELVVDTDSLRRPTGFSGVDFGADDGWDEDDDEEYDDDDDEFAGEDFGDDDFGDDDFGDDDFGDDDFGDEELGEDDFGARGRRRRRRLKRRLGRLNRREDRVRSKLAETRGRRRRRRRGRSSVRWGMTAISGTDTVAAPGGASVKVRLQHDFRAQDITFTGSAAGAKVTSIFFGDRVVWSSSDGIDVAVFGSTSFLRGLLKGQSLKAGLDITINGTVPAAGDFAVTLVGSKPVTPSC